jgi:peptidoglycan/xylan/chitin deacetylase (PgdA/CDA1 family)
MSNSGLILNYTEIGGEGKKSLSIDAFKEQMEYIASLDKSCCSLSSLGRKKNGDDNCIFLTFDGGHESDFSVVAPILKELGLKATFFIPANKFKEYDAVWEDYRALISAGHQIGSMGLNKSNFARLNVRQQLYELKKSKFVLEHRLQTQVNFFALPNGKFNHHTIRLASEAEYKMVFTSRFGFISLSALPFLTNRWQMTNRVSLQLLKKVTNEDRFILKSMKFKYVFAKLWSQLTAPMSYS